MKNYKQIITTFETACNEHLNVQTFLYGGLNNLDALDLNKKYPLVFLRPMSSAGLQNNTRSLNFELYALDVPKLKNETALDVMSTTEQIIYDIIGWFNRGVNQQDHNITLNGIVPVFEVFQDRLFGFSADITYTEEGNYNYCKYPKL